MQRFIMSGILLATLSIVPALSASVAYADSNTAGHQTGAPVQGQSQHGQSQHGQGQSHESQQSNPHRAAAQAQKQARDALKSQFLSELQQVKADRTASQTEHKVLVTSFHNFVLAVQSAVKAGDVTDLQSAESQAKAIMNTLHTAISDQKQADTNTQSAQSESSAASNGNNVTAQANHWNTAIARLQAADALINAKTTAMEDAVSSLNGLTSTLTTEVQAYAAAHPNATTNNTNNTSSTDSNSSNSSSQSEDTSNQSNDLQGNNNGTDHSGSSNSDSNNSNSADTSPSTTNNTSN